MDRYIGLDAHASSCTVAVDRPQRQAAASQVVETNARALIQVIERHPQARGTSASRKGPSRAGSTRCSRPTSRRSSSSASRRAAGPRATSATPSPWPRSCASARYPRQGLQEARSVHSGSAYLAKAYQALVADSVRVQNRIKSLLRSRGVPVSGRRCLHHHWPHMPISTSCPSRPEPMAEFLYCQYDHLGELRKQAQKEMITEARKHAVYRLREDLPRPGRRAHGPTPRRRRHALPLREQDASSGPTAGSPSSSAARPTGSAPEAASGSRLRSSRPAG